MSKPIDESLWAAIKEDYITGDIGYRLLAERHGVHWRSIAARGKRESWPDLRQQHRDAVTAQVLRDAKNATAKRQCKHMEKLQDAADRMADIIMEALAKESTYKDPAGNYDAKRLRDLSYVVRDMIAITRNVYDLPSIQEQNAMDIAIERLKLDQRKVEQADKDTNEGIEIVMGEGVKELAQ